MQVCVISWICVVQLSAPYKSRNFSRLLMGHGRSFNLSYLLWSQMTVMQVTLRTSMIWINNARTKINNYSKQMYFTYISIHTISAYKVKWIMNVLKCYLYRFKKWLGDKWRCQDIYWINAICILYRSIFIYHSLSSQHWFKKWLGAEWRLAISWINAD